jgi:predicted nucleotide-binding protein
MATSRKPVSQQVTKPADALIVDKANFTSKLLERISLGKELVDRQITNVDELEKNEKDYYKWDSYNSEYLKNSFNNENSDYKRNYDNVNSSFFVTSGSNNPSERLKDLKEDVQNKIHNLESLVEKVELLKSEIEIAQAKPLVIDKRKLDTTNIFIVHGHNTAIQQSVARTIEKLGLFPIILHEQANAGKTVIEKFETHSNVGFAIILLTDDDEGKSKVDIDLKKRARQNVVLELGYFIGKLGRSKVLPLYSDGVELPSDIHGLLYIPLDKAENWKFSIVKELKEAGYTVDANKLL